MKALGRLCKFTDWLESYLLADILTLLHSERPKLHTILALFKCNRVKVYYTMFFHHFLQVEQLFFTLCLLPCITNPNVNGIYS